jgi:chromosomal replication initiator protein
VSEASGVAVWNRVQQRLRGQVPDRSFETWIRPLSLLAVEDGSLFVGAPSSFVVDWVEEHYRPAIETCSAAEFGHPVKVVFSIHQSPEPPVEPPEPTAARPGLRASSGLNHRHTFETFVVGRSNQFACAAAQAVAEKPGMVYNPLFIYGGVGLGKTHILRAIGARNKQLAQDSRTVYVTGENFMIEMINAIQRGRAIEFKRRYRTMDLLLIDDVQFLAGKESTQEEFFHTFNALHQAHRQIVITSDRQPKELDGLEERLISRFGWGLVTDIQPPDLETRVAILRKHAEFYGVDLPGDVALLIGQNIKTNIRDLEGCLTRLIAQSRNANRSIDLPFTEHALNDLFRSQRRALNPRRIAEAVCNAYGIELEQIKGRKRTNAIALPRQVAMFLTRRHTGLSLAEIGREFGGRDHTTVMHACEKIERLSSEDPDVRATLSEITRALGVHPGS